MSDPPAMAPASSPTTSTEEYSTADVIRVKLHSGKIVWKVLVTLSGGQQFMSDQHWNSPAVAEAQLRRHLKALGCPEHKITSHTVN